MNEDLMQDWIKMYGREDRTQLAKPACIGRLQMRSVLKSKSLGVVRYLKTRRGRFVRRLGM